MLQHALIQRLDAQDRAWYLRLVLAESAPALTLSFWKMLTHVGGVTASILIAFIPLGFAEDALRAVARRAIARKTGARGLRSIMEGILLDTMFDLPGLEGVEQVVIGPEVVEGKARPLYIYAERNEKSGGATA